jgi:hypothetical protein
MRSQVVVLLLVLAALQVASADDPTVSLPGVHDLSECLGLLGEDGDTAQGTADHACL